MLADAAYDSILFDREEAVPDLAEYFSKNKRDADARFLAVQLLGFSGSERAIPVLLEALADTNADVRAEACRALEDLNHPATIPELESRLTDLSEDVRLAASDALETLRAAG